MQGQFTSGTNSIAQKAAFTALSLDYKEFDFMRESFLKRRDLMLKLLSDIPGLKMNKPHGAFYIFPDVSYYFGKKNGSTTVNNATELCTYLLSDAKVSVVTGEAFGDTNCVRFSYATSDDLLIEAAKRIKESLARLN